MTYAFFCAAGRNDISLMYLKTKCFVTETIAKMKLELEVSFVKAS